MASPAPRSSRRRSRLKASAAVAGSAPWRTRIQVGASRAVGHQPRGQAACASGLSATTRTGLRRPKPGKRQVRSGSSASTVPTPTITASWRARSRCARRAGRLAGDPAAFAARAVAMRPSSVVASFSVTSGRPRRTRLKKPALISSRLGGQQPVLDRDAGRAQAGDALAVDPRVGVARRRPRRGATPAAISASVQGGVGRDGSRAPA